MHRTLITLLPCLLLGCAPNTDNPSTKSSNTWSGELQVHGALRSMLHEGQTQEMVSLEALLPNSKLYAVGALADLSGEVTIVAGKAYLAFPEDAEHARVETTERSEAGAALLVSAEVPVWSSVTIEKPIRFDEIDDEISNLAATAGMHPGARFPFLLEGNFEDLQWHVIDGSRLTPGETSHQDHLAAGVKARRDRASATLVGFYSQTDQGVFTHMGSRTHLHCVLQDPLGSGHVDHVVIPAGTTLKLPVDPPRR